MGDRKLGRWSNSDDERVHEEHQARYQARAHAFQAAFRDPASVPTLAEALSGSTRARGLTTALIDNATVEQALFFVGFDEIGMLNRELFDNGPAVAHALNVLLEALVLNDEVLTGPSGYGPRLVEEHSSLRAIADVFSDRFDALPPGQLYGLLGVARLRALDLLDSQGKALEQALGRLGGQAVDADAVRTHLLEMSPHAADISSHKVEPFIEDTHHFLSVMTDSILGPAHYGTYGRNADEALSKAKQSSGMQAGRVHFGNDPTAFFAAHILYRAVLYLLLADIAGATYQGDDIRAPVVRAIIGPEQREPFATSVVRVLEAQEAARDQAVNATLGYAAFTVPVPLVAHFVMSRASRRDEVFDVAMEMRDSRPARRFRRFCHNVDDAIATGDRATVEHALSDLARAGLNASEAFQSNPGWDFTASKDLVSLYSPLAAALLTTFAYPITRGANALHSRKFGFLASLRAAPRAQSAFLKAQIDALWPDGYERPEETRFRHW